MDFAINKSNQSASIEHSKSILRAPFIAQLALKHCADARSLLGTSAAYGPSNHRGDTERGALTSGTLEYGIGDTETGNCGVMGRQRGAGCSLAS